MKKISILIVGLVLLVNTAYSAPVRVQNKARLEKRRAVEELKQDRAITIDLDNLRDRGSIIEYLKDVQKLLVEILEQLEK